MRDVQAADTGYSNVMGMTVGMTRRAALGSAIAVAVGAGTAAAAESGTRPANTPLWREFPAPPSPTPRSPTSAGPAAAAASDLPRRRRRRRRPALRRRTGRLRRRRPRDQPCHRRRRRARRWHGPIPPGTYRIDDLIRIGHSNVVLRGAGSGRTTLYATKNLTELDRRVRQPLRRRQVLLVLGRRTHLALPRRTVGTALTAAIKAKAWPFEGWTGNRRDEWRTLTTVAPARRGDLVRSPSTDTGQLQPRRARPAPPRRRRRPHAPGAHGGRRPRAPRRTSGTTRPS